MTAGLAIHRLHARTPAGAQPVAARLALQALGADLGDALPRRLPPQALLWLRRLQLQVPAAALARPAPLAWRQDWIATGRERLDTALDQAARPALGPVPDSAPAVLFADAAEMLACLLLAAARGELDRWWWRGLLGRGWPDWPRAWQARPEACAAALRLLRAQPLSAAVRRELARVLPAGAALPWLDEPGGRERDDEHCVQPPRVEAGMRMEAVLPPAQPARRQARAVPASAAGGPAADVPRLIPSQGVAGSVGAAESPPPMQTNEVAAPPAATKPGHGPAARPRAVTQSLAEPAASPQPAPEPAEFTPDPQPSPAAPVPVPVQAPVVHAVPAVPDAPVPPASVQHDPAPAQRLSAGQVATTRASGSPAAFVRPAEAPGTRRPELPLREPAAAVAAPPAPLAEPAPQTWPWPEALLTRQAPLLFLVNALLEDGLYPDFTRPRDPGLPVPLWALLAALAAAWRLPPDPLPAALAARSGDWLPPDLMPAAPGAAAGPWPAWLPAYARSLRRRLCRRLGWRTAQWPQQLTLDHPARVWLSEAELVAEFELAGHDVAWRLAGLDRDPGWLPSACCTLRFRFD